ncbi:universal stress protein [Steroidobacter agaridevorans]|uniref:Universal stress protein n=1 Tax=Steroidobacter agaridevorans TaxID=2695856 RepID=A0A829Y9T9_9GAMM|nr:universal stress protein [Steroidobacter agaridevorans]GFE80087.1 universal stress protein [Steroidobacter agaridevorans]GFE89943.1 universal stress protein [Steroidobacter agaridevorans]
MRSTQTILVPVDGSDPSTRALEYAVDRVTMAGKGSLRVVNVQLGMPASRYVSRDMIAEHQHRLADAALKAARALLKRRKLDADISVHIGDPAATIVTLAKRRGCSEIVMGSRGRGRVAGMLLGSVASKVIQLSPCPVTIVK